MKKLTGVTLVIGFFILLTLTLSDYGINEDSPGHFLRGQAYLQKLTTGKDSFELPRLPTPIFFIPGQRISLYKFNAWETSVSPLRSFGDNPGTSTIQEASRRAQADFGRQSFYKHNAWSGAYFTSFEGPGHPPLSDILAATTNRLFYEKLGWAGDIAGYHLYIIFTSVLAVGLVFLFAAKNWGRLTGLLAGLSLALYPFYFAESHFNLKDIPELAFTTGALMSFYFWFRQSAWRWFWAFTLFFILALGTKLDTLLLPLIFLPWLVTQVRLKAWGKWFGRELLLQILIFGVAVAGIFFATWPYLWQNPFPKILEILKFYVNVGGTDTRIQEASAYLLLGSIDLTGLVYVLTMTPIPILILALTGIIWGIREMWQRKNSSPVILVFIWLTIPLLRELRPGAATFGSIRQYAEFLPALAILAGLGGTFLLRKGARVGMTLFSGTHFPASFFFVTGVAVYIALLSWNLASYHPNENVYFNFLIGGPKGALEKNLLNWQTSYDNLYLQATKWLNQNAPQEAKLAYLDGSMLAISPLFLRPDIHFGSFFSGLAGRGEYIISLVYPDPPKVFPYLYLERFLKPVYVVAVDDVPLVKVWKNDPSRLLLGYFSLTQLSGWRQSAGRDAKFGDYWEVDFERTRSVVSLTVNIPKDVSCDQSDGLFNLTDFMVPQRVDRPNSESVFYFPAEATSRVRFYGLAANSCILEGTVTNVNVLAQ